MNTTTLLTKLDRIFNKELISKQTTLNIINENNIIVFNGGILEYATNEPLRKVLDNSLVLASNINQTTTTIYIEEM